MCVTLSDTGGCQLLRDHVPRTHYDEGGVESPLLAGGNAWSSPCLARRAVHVTNANNVIKTRRATRAYLSWRTVFSTFTTASTVSAVAASAVRCLRLTASNVSSASNTSNATGPILRCVTFFIATRSVGGDERSSSAAAAVC